MSHPHDMTFILYFSFNIKLNVSQGFYYLSTQNKLSTLFIVAVYRTPSGSQLLSKYSTRMVFGRFFSLGILVLRPWRQDFIILFSTRSFNQLQNIETVWRKKDLSCFKSVLVTGLWDTVILTSLLPSIQSCSSKFWAWSCIARNFDKEWRGDYKHKIMDTPFKPKYGTVSQVLLELVVVYN